MKFFYFVISMLWAASVFAQDKLPAGNAAPDGWQQMSQLLLLMGMIFIVFYFLLIRPQQKERQKHEERINSLKKGDQVIGAGGIYGSIIGLKDEKAVIKIAENVKIEILKSSITHILGEGEK